MYKKHLVLLTSSILLLSCNSNKISELNHKINILENENKSLKTKLEKTESNKILSTQLYLMPNKIDFKLNQPNTIQGVFSEIQEYPKFEAYYLDKNDRIIENDRIEIRMIDKNRFEFDYTPKTTSNNKEIKIGTFFKINDSKMTLYGLYNYRIEE
jgi:hypothetical protein